MQDQTPSPRDVLIYEAVHRHNYRLRDAGDFLGLHFSIVSVVASRQVRPTSIQEQRSDPF